MKASRLVLLIAAMTAFGPLAARAQGEGDAQSEAAAPETPAPRPSRPESGLPPSSPARSAEPEAAPALREAAPTAEPASSANDDKGAKAPAPSSAAESMCLIIEAAARAHELPVEFFARVIWQESRFQPNAVGPVTRSGERAQGIAQFMPGTAAERRLLNPFDPVQALPKSAEFLRELRAEFGNLGLAAAAYNAGPQRVRNWLAGSGSMPAETRNYVAAITGLSVEQWAKLGSDAARPMPPNPGCRTLIATLRRAPNPFVQQLEARVKVVATRPWGVQLSAGFSRDRALAAFSALVRRYSGVLAGHDPSILASTLRSRGTRTFFQVRIGAETRVEADNLCGRIRRVGGACLVLRNLHGRA